MGKCKCQWVMLNNTHDRHDGELSVEVWTGWIERGLTPRGFRFENGVQCKWSRDAANNKTWIRDIFICLQLTCNTDYNNKKDWIYIGWKCIVVTKSWLLLKTFKRIPFSYFWTKNDCNKFWFIDPTKIRAFSESPISKF